MTALLAIALFLHEPGSPRLLDVTLGAPVDAVPVEAAPAVTAESIRWRVLGVAAGALGGGAGLAMFLREDAAFREDRTALTVGGAVLGAVVGGPVGYLVGRYADEGASPARIGIGCTCLVDGMIAGLLLVGTLHLVGNV